MCKRQTKDIVEPLLRSSVSEESLKRKLYYSENLPQIAISRSCCPRHGSIIQTGDKTDGVTAVLTEAPARFYTEQPALSALLYAFPRTYMVNSPSMSKQAQGDKKLKSPEIAPVSSVTHGANKGKKAGDFKRGDNKESEGRGSRVTTPEKVITKGNGAPCQMVAPGKSSHGGNKHPGSSQKAGKTIDRNNIVSDKDGKVKNSSPLRCVEGDSARDSPSRTSTAKSVVGLVSSAPAPERHKTFSPWKSRVGDSVLTDITTGNNAQVCGQVIANPQVCGGQVFGEKITTVALVSASYSGQETLGRSHVGRAPDVQSAVAAGIRNGPLADPLGEGTGILSGEYRLSDCSEGVLSGDYRSITDSGFISRSYGSTSSTTTAVVSSLSRACAKTVANTMPGENHAPKSSGTSSSASDAGKTATTSESEQSQSSNGSKQAATVNRTETTQKEPDQTQPGPDSAAPEGEIAGNGTASLSESTISEPSISISDRQNPTSTQAPVTMGVETTVVTGTGVSPQGSTLSLPVATSSCPTGASNGSVASSDITVSTAMASTSDTSSSVGSTSTAPPGAAVGNNKSKTKLEWRRRMHSSPIERSVENPPPSPRFAFSFDVPQPKTSAYGIHSAACISRGHISLQNDDKDSNLRPWDPVAELLATKTRALPNRGTSPGVLIIQSANPGARRDGEFFVLWGKVRVVGKREGPGTLMSLPPHARCSLRGFTGACGPENRWIWKTGGRHVPTPASREHVDPSRLRRLWNIGELEGMKLHGHCRTVPHFDLLTHECERVGLSGWMARPHSVTVRCRVLPGLPYRSLGPPATREEEQHPEAPHVTITPHTNRV
ncbi:hypothetical protein Bbelb_443870 [Branchiostoma belcheri]|nr:hypothetical protein Bbelb_443870 [Branchiostoma belcheri]